jgi:hypothetical protein
MVGAVAGRPVPVDVRRLVAWQQPIERGHQVAVRAGADLDDHEAGRRMRDEDRQEPVGVLIFRNEGRTRRRQVEQPAPGAGPDAELASPYGKMLRRASRRRARLPIAGADS